MSKRMKSVKDLKGMKFGRLLVLSIDGSRKRKTYWQCLCECGNGKLVRSDSLQDGSVKSCGCLKKEQDKINLTAYHSHLQSGSRLYATWQGMKSRCYYPADERYERYGGRGIVVCDKWLHDFACFYRWAIKSGYRDDLTIDRINNNGNYEPSNCHFATSKEQCNNRQSNIVIHFAERDYTLTEICVHFSFPYHTIHARYARGTRGLDLIEPIRQYRDN